MTGHRATLIPGDGIGPEITEATIRIVEAAGVAAPDVVGTTLRGDETRTLEPGSHATTTDVTDAVLRRLG